MRMAKILTGIVVAVIALLLVTGCASPSEPVTTGPDFNGFITGVNTIDNEDIVGSIAVESHADKLIEKYVVTIKKDTSIFRLVDGNYQEITFGDLEEKQWLEIWFDGPVAESWPMQAKALQVVITP
jgi:hypothetical protein